MINWVLEGGLKNKQNQQTNESTGLLKRTPKNREIEKRATAMTNSQKYDTKSKLADSHHSAKFSAIDPDHFPLTITRPHNEEESPSSSAKQIEQTPEMTPARQLPKVRQSFSHKNVHQTLTKSKVLSAEQKNSQLRHKKIATIFKSILNRKNRSNQISVFRKLQAILQGTIERKAYAMTVGHSIQQIIFAKETFLKRVLMQKLKNRQIKQNVVQLKTSSKVQNMIRSIKSTVFGRIIELLTKSKMRTALNLLQKHQSEKKQTAYHLASTFKRMLKARLQTALGRFKHGKQKQKILATFAKNLQSFGNIRTKLLYSSFQKLLLKASPQSQPQQLSSVPSVPSASTSSPTQLKIQTNQLQKASARTKQLQKQLAEFQSQKELQFNELQWKGEQITRYHRQLMRDLQIKKTKNKVLTEKVDDCKDQQLPLPLDMDRDLEDDENLLMNIPHEIYSQIFRMSESEVQANLDQIITNYKLEEGKTNEIIRNWDLQYQNMFLKAEIGQFEQCISSEPTASLSLHAKNKLLVKLIRDYIRERYMWEEVKTYLALQ